MTCHERGDQRRFRLPRGVEGRGDRLLIERPSFLCQDCHANSGHQSGIYSGAQLYNTGPGLPYKVFPPTGAAITNFRAFARGCVNCHSQIHGSNNPSGAYFTR